MTTYSTSTTTSSDSDLNVDSTEDSDINVIEDSSDEELYYENNESGISIIDDKVRLYIGCNDHIGNNITLQNNDYDYSIVSEEDLGNILKCDHYNYEIIFNKFNRKLIYPIKENIHPTLHKTTGCWCSYTLLVKVISSNINPETGWKIENKYKNHTIMVTNESLNNYIYMGIDYKENKNKSTEVIMKNITLSTYLFEYPLRIFDDWIKPWI